MKKPKFKDRYVLGVGYPDYIDVYASYDFLSISLWTKRSDSVENGEEITLKVPKVFFHQSDVCPKYRLVLEKVK